MLFPGMEEERAAHEYAAHKRYKVPHTMPGKWTKEIGRSMQIQDAALQGLGLLYFLALQGINLITAEEEDLVVAENLLRGRISVLGGGELHKLRAHDRAQ